MGQDPAHCSRCSGGAVRLSLQDLLEGLQGRTFREVVQRHIQRYPVEELRDALRRTRHNLPAQTRRPLEAAAQQEAGRVIRNDLWNEPADQVLQQALQQVQQTHGSLDDSASIDVGELMILEVAVALYREKQLRQQARVRTTGLLGKKYWRLWTGLLGAGLWLWGTAFWMEGVGILLLATVASSLIARWLQDRDRLEPLPVGR